MVLNGLRDWTKHITATRIKGMLNKLCKFNLRRMFI